MNFFIENKRWIRTLALAACLFASLSGCKNEKVPPQPAAKGPIAPSADQLQTDVALPANSDVVGDIYGNSEGGEYWYGRTFLLGERRYHVGFAYSMLEQAQSEDNGFDSPGALVSVSHVTYALVGSQWQKIVSARDIGRFGARNQAPTVETDSSAAELVESSERYILSVPTRYIEMGGVEMRFAEIFAFDASAPAWKYLGSVYTGENNDAGCTDEGKTVSGADCTASVGELKFSPNAQTGFPDISVVRSGTTLGNDRKARALAAADTMSYTYSASSSAYAQSQKK